MIQKQEIVTGEMPMVATYALHEIKNAVRELRGATPDSVLVSLAEQKIEMIERDLLRNQDFENADMVGGLA
jgi:hypothetical protein